MVLNELIKRYKNYYIEIDLFAPNLGMRCRTCCIVRMVGLLNISYMLFGTLIRVKIP